MLYKIARAGKTKKNACRNLHLLLNKSQAFFPVPIDAVLVRVCLRRPTLRRAKLWWPILRFSDWVRVLLERAPHILLAGHDLEESEKWKAVFREFWDNYQSVNPDHVIYTNGMDTSMCIPYFLHGDEGRSLRNRSFMIESFQPVISKRGPGFTNESGLLDCSMSVYVLARGIR